MYLPPGLWARERQKWKVRPAGRRRFWLQLLSATFSDRTLSYSRWQMSSFTTRRHNVYVMKSWCYILMQFTSEIILNFEFLVIFEFCYVSSILNLESYQQKLAKSYVDNIFNFSRHISHGMISQIGLILKCS